MFVRTPDDLQAAGRVVSLNNGAVTSARVITAADGIGFSYNDNRIAKADGGFDLWYKHHWEGNYIVSGRGRITDLSSGDAREVGPGTLYVVGPNDRHRVEVTEDMHVLSIFCPALQGDERHDADGAYPPSGPVPQTDRRMFFKDADQMRADGIELTLRSGARSLRMLTKADGVGFGFSVVNAPGYGEATLWYKNHWEANHILAGEGEVTDLATGQTWKLFPGVSYNVGPKDRHLLKNRDIVLVSVFCPPLQGDEAHDADGALAPSGPIPPGPPGY